MMGMHAQVLARHPNYPKIREDILDAGIKKVRAGSEREERRALGLLRAAG